MARNVRGRSNATRFCTNAHRGPMWSRGDTRPATGYRLRGLATRPLTPLHRDTVIKKKKEKYPGRPVRLPRIIRPLPGPTAHARLHGPP